MAARLFDSAITEVLLRDLKRANTEQAKKERFLQYLTAMFAGDEGAQTLISDLSLGAERTISNIPRGPSIGRGRADTQTETVIIEWERDLSRTGEHAQEQLEEYLLGNWRSGEVYRFILLATDGIKWRRYAPDWASMATQRGRLTEVELREVAAFDLRDETIRDFPFFLDETLFGTQPRGATLSRIQTDFGDTSMAFINSLRILQDAAGDVTADSELQVAFEQWQRFLSLAYGRFDSSTRMFLVHTYLSVFAKFIAYAVVTGRSALDEAATRAVLDGSAFQNLNIERFVEDDFFHWVHSDTYLTALRPMFREISRRIREYDFSDVSEDILKGVYQELIDLETRHALGEYYTPDWLCEKIVNSLPMDRASRILDPACGSGSFLRAAMARLREISPDLTAGQLSSQVVGIDIHPLSVQISKTTLLLAMGDKIQEAQHPIVLQIFLANSLLVPRGSANLFETSFEVSVDNELYTLDITGLAGSDAFDSLVSLCDELAERYEQLLPRARFLELVKQSIPTGTSHTLPGQLFDIYAAMKAARQAGRDSIWKFILQNSYKPVFLMNRFDIVVGNPPWLTYADVGSAEYQVLLRRLADHYGVTPASRANMPHLEIAAIFLAHATNYFLSEAGGTLAFVLPRAFMTADQHHNMRAGMINGLKISSLWDLKEVTPLFRVPSCVLFAVPEGRQARQALPASGIPGLRVAGRLPSHHCNLAQASPRLQDHRQTWHYSTLQAGSAGRVRSALTRLRIEGQRGGNAYGARFKQGATIVPRNFYFVEVEQQIPEGQSLAERTVAVRTADYSNADARGEWKGKLLSGRVEGALLFRTAISRNVLPFCLIEPLLVTLPLRIRTTDGGQRFAVTSSDDLLRAGFRHASAWFHQAEQTFEEHKSESYRRAGMTLLRRLDFQNGIGAQSPSARYLVLYTSSATDASAVIIDRQEFDLPFVVESKTYWCEVRSLAEGHYVAGFLNSGYANEAIKDFQSQGLFGERDIHKTIVKLPLAAFDRRNEAHVRISDLAAQCAARAEAFATTARLAELDPRSLGRARTQIRRHLHQQMEEIDLQFYAMTSRAGAAQVARARRLQLSGAGPLFSN